MRIWTVQPERVWELLKEREILFVDEAQMSYASDVYSWLAGQLQQRLPAYAGGLPWFAYCDKPDLRWVRHRTPAGEPRIRIELEPVPGSFYIFPRWAWDTIYCGQYLALSQDEHDAWVSALGRAVPGAEETQPPPEPWVGEIRASWERLFRGDLPVQRWTAHPVIDDTGIREAAIGALRLVDVRDVTAFRGSNRRLRTPSWCEG